jgi:hypothetical protein
MRGKEWTHQQDRKLVDLVNGYQSKQGMQIRWDDIPVGKYFRSRNSMTSRWNRTVKHKVEFKDGQYVLPELNLFDKPEKPLALPRPLRAPKKTTKTYLWGLYTVTHEQ